MNKFIVNTSILLLALQHVQKVITKNPVVPILENFLFRIANQVLTVSASDLQTTFKVSFKLVDCRPDLKVTAVVPADILKYLQKLGEAPLQLEYDPVSYSLIASELSTEFSKETGYKIIGRAKYSGENPEDFPREPQTKITAGTFETTSDIFGEFKDLLNYASADELRPAMSGIGFMQYLGAFQIVATDAHKLKTVTIPELSHPCKWSHKEYQTFRDETEERIRKYRRMALPIANKYAERLQAQLDAEETRNVIQHFILRSKAARVLSSLKFGTAKKPEPQTVFIDAINNDEGHLEYVVFRFQYLGFDVELITKPINERYPQYWNVIPDDAVTKYTTDKEKFLKVLDKAELFANKNTHQIRLSLNGKNKISAEDLDFSSEYCAEVGGTYEGEPIDIGFNSKLLRDVVKSFGDSFTLEMKAKNRPAVIRDGNALALVMPVALHHQSNTNNYENCKTNIEKD